MLRKETEPDNQEEETEKTALRFRAVYVFEVIDTEGNPLPELGNAEGDPCDQTERLKEFIASRGIQLEYSDAIYPPQGPCSPGKIVLLPGRSAAEEFLTLARETADSLLHQSDRRTETIKRVRETEAEAVALVVCEAMGIKARTSADYMQLYSGDKETLTESLDHIPCVSAEVLSAIALPE